MKKVLIVEDQRMPRENMERILLDSGKYKLCASVNGADVALAVCRREKIDLILMDVCTAGNKDGIEAAAEIKLTFYQKPAMPIKQGSQSQSPIKTSSSQAARKKIHPLGKWYFAPDLMLRITM